MIQYILECIAFQLVFLLIYDLFLKRETFFQWNRVYLIGTYALSIVLPLIKIEAFRTKVASNFTGYSEFLWNLDQQPILLNSQTVEAPLFTSQELIYLIGAILASVWFGIKMWRLYQLRKQGDVHYFRNFTQILIPKSSVAFSFFKSIFLGEGLPKKEYEAIISHELVHIKQRHTLDLLFFELMRIVSWFNPLVYVYQNRISELHEFIADAQVPKTERKAHYDLLLSQVFQTQHISFVNQFFKSSLIKKRIVMLNKSKSKKVWQLKYLMLVPLIVGMLFYTSCEQNEKENPEQELEAKELKTETIAFLEIDEVPIFPNCEDADNKRDCFNEMMQQHISKNFKYPIEAQELDLQGRVNLMFTIDTNGKVDNIEKRGPHYLLEDEAVRIINKLPIMQPGLKNGELVNMSYSIPISFRLAGGKASEVMKEGYWKDKGEVPFSYVDNVPIFPGCENNGNARACFNQMMQRHISKNFNYPEEAIERGIEGQVNVMFTVSEDGSIIDIRKKGPNKLLENEVERMIKKLPKMTPGNYGGKDVNVPYSIPVTFKLE